MVAESAVRTMSTYYKSLDLVAKKRYDEKLKYSKGNGSLPDPFSLSDGWSESPNSWPGISFGDIYLNLIHKTLHSYAHLTGERKQESAARKGNVGEI